MYPGSDLFTPIGGKKPQTWFEIAEEQRKRRMRPAKSLGVKQFVRQGQQTGRGAADFVFGTVKTFKEVTSPEHKYKKLKQRVEAMQKTREYEDKLEKLKAEHTKLKWAQEKQRAEKFEHLKEKLGFKKKSIYGGEEK